MRTIEWRQRIWALLLILASASQCLVAHPARADERRLEGQVLGRSGTLDQDLTQYFEAYYSGREWELAAHRSRIQRRIFESPGSPEYVQALEWIDSLASKHPLAVFSLGLYLQRHWEARYAAAVSCHSDGVTSKGAQIGALVGLTTLGAAMLHKPLYAARYFRLFRYLLPLAGSGMGAAIANSRIQPTNGGYPIAPAHLMRLGLPEDFREMGEAALLKESLELVRSLAIGTAAYATISTTLPRLIHAVSTLNKVATPFKVNLVVLAGTFVLGYAADQAVAAGIRHYGISKRRSSMRDIQGELEVALARRDPESAFTAAHQYVAAAIDLARFLNEPVMRRIRDFELQIQLVESPEKLAKLAMDFQKDVTRIRRRLDRESIRSDLVLTQASDYLSSSGQAWLEGHSDLLISVLNGQQALACEAGIGGSHLAQGGFQ